MSFFGGWSMPWSQQGQAPVATSPYGAQSTTAMPPSPVTEAQSKMGFFPSMMSGFGQNSGMLMGMASGLLTSPAQGGGWGAAMDAGMRGQTVDMQRRRLAMADAEKKAKNDALRAFLSGQKLDAPTAALLINNPELAQQVIGNSLTPKDPQYVSTGEGGVVAIGGRPGVFGGGGGAAPGAGGGPGVQQLVAPRAPEQFESFERDDGSRWKRSTRTNEETMTAAPRQLKQQFDPYETQQMKDKAESETSWRTTAEGSEAYLRKLARLREKITDRDDIFGPMQASGPSRFFAGIAGTDAEKDRQRVEADLADMELDVAKLKLKGQGAVSEAERSIAKATLPKLTNADSSTALKILDQLEVEARENLAIAAQKGVYRPSGVGGGQQQQAPAGGAPP